MNLVRNAAVLVLVTVLGCASVAVAADDRPIVVVFNVEFQGLKLSRTVQNNLSDYLTGKLAGALSRRNGARSGRTGPPS